MQCALRGDISLPYSYPHRWSVERRRHALEKMLGDAAEPSFLGGFENLTTIHRNYSALKRGSNHSVAIPEVSADGLSSFRYAGLFKTNHDQDARAVFQTASVVIAPDRFYGETIHTKQ